MLDSALRECGGQVVAYLLLVPANIRGRDIGRNDCVDGLRAGERFRERIRASRVCDEWLGAPIFKSFQALRVTTNDAYFLSLGQQFLSDYASRVSCGTCNNIQKLLLEDDSGNISTGLIGCSPRASRF